VNLPQYLAILFEGIALINPSSVPNAMKNEVKK